MKKELLEQINEAKYTIENNPIILGIVTRTRNKFFNKSEEQVVIYDMLDYIKSQLQWKKQSFYEWLLPVILECCEIMEEDFEALFENDPQYWRAAHNEIF